MSEDKELSRGAKKRAEKRERNERQDRRQGPLYQLTLGLPSMAVNFLLFFCIEYLLGLLYKVGARVENVGIGENYYFVNPWLGSFCILLVFVLKNICDIRFHAMQKDAKEADYKWMRLFSWSLYLLVMAFMEVITFLEFTCGDIFLKRFFDTYTFDSAFLGNVMYGLLFLVMPFAYPLQALVRKILTKRNRKD